MELKSSEMANLIEGLRRIGFKDVQINDMMLMMAGTISIREWEIRYRKAMEE
ncbi:MAG: hypothetical protein II966_05230 [Lachnospiraceae bacterium]|nr:hypothetical protein [Lachnospiraceae bacterium]